MSGARILILGVGLAIGLAGCAGELVKVPERVEVPTPVACVSASGRPQKPVLRTQADLMAMDRYRRTIAAWSDLQKAEVYAAELEAIVEGCSRIPP